MRRVLVAGAGGFIGGHLVKRLTAEGFRVRGGPDAVGRAATSGVVWSTFFVILADVFFTAIFYMLHWK